MKSFIAAALVAIAFAAEDDFPHDDAFHADCHVDTTFEGMTCDEVYTAMDKEIRSWNTDTTSPSGGVYTLKEEGSDKYIWSTRLTKNKKYTDDQMFEFDEENTGCQVKDHSRSKSMSVYDYSVNYCNLWNAYNGVSANPTVHVGDCASTPSDPVSTCATY